MQTESTIAARQTTPDLARTHATLRFAFGVTLALVACELLRWVPTFLGPVLVAVLLVNVPIRPPVKVAVGLIAIIAAAALIAMVLSTALVRSPLILFGVAAVIVFRSLYVIAALPTPRSSNQAVTFSLPSSLGVPSNPSELTIVPSPA